MIGSKSKLIKMALNGGVKSGSFWIWSNTNMILNLRYDLFSNSVDSSDLSSSPNRDGLARIGWQN
jgi:hypothetical protein